MLLFISIAIVLIAIIAAVYNYRENRSTLYLSCILVLFSTYSLTHYFTIYGKDPYMLALFYGHFSPLWYLLGPFVFFYARSLFDQKRSKKNWTDFLHFIPFILHIISVYQYYSIPFEVKLAIANRVIEDLNNLPEFDIINNVYSQKLAFFLRPSFLFIYSTYSLVYVIKRAKNQYVEYYNWVLFFLISMIALAITFGSLTYIVLASKDLKETLLHSPFHLLSGFGFLSVPASIITIFPEIIYGKRTFKPKKKAFSSDDEKFTLSFETSENEIIAQKIQDYLEENKPFLNPDFSITDLEKGIQEDAESIRICLKYILKKKFTELRSEYRVNYAKHLLENGTTKNTSIDGIGVLSGFSNRANFYSTFKLIAGKTPTEYLKQLNE